MRISAYMSRTSRTLQAATLLISSLACTLPAAERDRTPVSPIQEDIPQKPPAPTNPTPSRWGQDSLSKLILGPDNAWDSAYAALQEWKKKYHVPISVGGQSWFHIDRDGPYNAGVDYGVPGLHGTYYYYVKADPSLELDSEYVQEIGIHEEFRFRTGTDKLRSFYRHTYWNWELYGYAKTPVGQFKVGQIWKRFGSDWDTGTWWGSVHYFDGFKLDPDYGVSWENTWKFGDRFALDSFVQYFIAEDGINGSIAGADTESVPGLSERHSVNIRLVPTWRPAADTSVALGVSGMISEIDHGDRFGLDTQRNAFALDLTAKWKGFTVVGEFTKAYGAVNPAHYVSGGPSDEITDWLVGASYKAGPLTLRCDFSRGEQKRPNGHQTIFIPGVTVQLTDNITAYAEYVRWNVTNSAGVKSKFEDGYQVAFVYSF